MRSGESVFQEDIKRNVVFSERMDTWNEPTCRKSVTLRKEKHISFFVLIPLQLSEDGNNGAP